MAFLVISHIILNGAKLASARDLFLCSMRTTIIQKERIETSKADVLTFSRLIELSGSRWEHSSQ